MAGHSHFKNVMHRKGAQDAKRAKQFSKLVREIAAAVKIGGGIDPEFNPRLRTAITAARAANLPRDRVEGAIKKASSSGDKENFEEITYECYAPGGIALIIEGLTDNRNRTSSDVKAATNKYGAALAEPGSVLYMFDRIGLIEFNNPSIDEEKFLEASIEFGANECMSQDTNHVIYCNPEDLHEMRTKLTPVFGEPNVVKLSWNPKNTILIDNVEKAEILFKFIDALEESDDIQTIYGNYIIADEIIDKVKV